MPDYRRAWHPGGTCFFTVNLLQRQGNDLLTRHAGALRETVRSVRQRHPCGARCGHAAQCPLVIAPYASCSTFHRLVEQGIYPLDWAGGDEAALSYLD